MAFTLERGFLTAMLHLWYLGQVGPQDETQSIYINFINLFAMTHSYVTTCVTYLGSFLSNPLK
jgi:hypothetical protein